MNSLVFSEDESADSIWSPPSDDCYWFNSIQTNLTRTDSELRFEELMEEFSASTSAAEQVYNPPVIDTGSDSPPKLDLTPEEWEEAVKFADGCLVSDPDEDIINDESNSDVNSMLSKELVLRPLDLPPLPPLDSDCLRGYLINQLERACASVAQRWQRSEPSTTNGSGRDLPMAQSEVYGAPYEISALPPLQRRSGAQVKQAACGSSRDEARHIRRMMANRESARCSIIREEEEMIQIEREVGVLKAAYSKLLENLSAMEKKCGTSYYELKVLRDEYEITKTQISMHELQIMRLTGLHPLNNPEFLALVNSPTHASKNAARPIPSRHQFFHQPVPTVANGTPQLHTTTPNSYFWKPTK
ncbi:light-inducible protein CPRF2 [Quercus suber]|uniref:light-inducible protein CPRF2 n=1 Tax=Quercus suber TaxID=58331 RepID=UPI000D295199|nr:basic leucine zipper 25 [Quercus suber]